VGRFRPRKKGIPAPLQTASTKPPLYLLFVANRTPAKGQDHPAPGPYTANPSRSLAFGSANVAFSEGVAGDELVRQGTVARWTSQLELKLGPSRELARFPGIPAAVTGTRQA
jgi:hypothetical protein